MDNAAGNRRILVVDDNVSIHDDFRRILLPRKHSADLDEVAATLFGEPVPALVADTTFALDYAQQGEEGCRKASDAVAHDRPFAVAFVDMRMPPGWDGLTTAQRLWEIDPNIQIVICTAYSDRSWTDIHNALTARDSWLVLKKPFDRIEVLQLAQALTEKWQLARQARTQLANLETHVALRTEQLRRATQVKNEFLANVTHELLTPLHGIVGNLELLADSTLTDDQTGCVHDARISAGRLTELLRQIVAFNQAEAGTLNLDPVHFDPARLLEEVAAPYRDVAARKGIALTTHAAAAVTDVFAPVAIVREVLHALLDNAVKFTKHGAIRVDLAAAGPELCFSVSDTGAGMDDAELAWIEEPFAQVDGGVKRRTGGMGLGLPLAKRLAAAVGGELSLRSRTGEGTHVAFTFVESARNVSCPPMPAPVAVNTAPESGARRG